LDEKGQAVLKKIKKNGLDFLSPFYRGQSALLASLTLLKFGKIWDRLQQEREIFD